MTLTFAVNSHIFKYEKEEKNIKNQKTQKTSQIENSTYANQGSRERGQKNLQP